MKIRILVVICVFLPVIACAQEDFDTDVIRDNEISRSLAMIESQAEFSASQSHGQYEYAIANAEQDANYTMESTLAAAEENYQEAVENDQAAQAITERADSTVQEAMDAALQETAPESQPQPVPQAQDDFDYTNLQQKPQPPLKLPPPDSEIKNQLSKGLQAMVGQRAYASFGVNSGVINGFTMYRIEFENAWADGGHMESQLVWPLRNVMMGITGQLNYRTSDSTEEDPRSLCSLGVKWQTNVSDGSGHIQDSDWIENDVGFIEDQMGAPQPWAWNHPGKDIYSEADTEVDGANIVDVTGTYNLWLTKGIAIAPRIGYRYQKFMFSSYNLDQVGYGPYGPPWPFDQSYLDTQHRQWLKYSTKYRFPYLGLGSEMKWKDLSLFSHFDYSPWVNVRDADTHLYPTDPFGTTMVSDGHHSGRAYIFGFDAGWQFLPNWRLTAGTSYVKIYAAGSYTQRTYIGGILVGVSDPVTARLANKYWLTDASVQYVF